MTDLTNVQLLSLIVFGAILGWVVRKLVPYLYNLFWDVLIEKFGEKFYPSRAFQQAIFRSKESNHYFNKTLNDTIWDLHNRIYNLELKNKENNKE